MIPFNAVRSSARSPGFGRRLVVTLSRCLDANRMVAEMSCGVATRTSATAALPPESGVRTVPLTAVHNVVMSMRRSLATRRFTDVSP
ncbi:hypothetical protein GCM10010178_81720 [Lentzea flava]|uniref:Uncharacterized protein n=1 Tax=Lentzea flava TaxID=103732 RepID=A0ABQ2VCL8_9PSEU|nr:hypothetical protein GCM10010178_81720 [Lentzea flava]